MKEEKRAQREVNQKFEALFDGNLILGMLYFTWLMYCNFLQDMSYQTIRGLSDFN